MASPSRSVSVFCWDRGADASTPRRETATDPLSTLISTRKITAP